MSTDETPQWWTDTLQSISEWILAVLENVGNQIADIIRPIIDTIREYTFDITRQLKNLFELVKGEFLEFTENIVTYIYDLVNEAVSVINDIKDSILNTITEIVDQAAGYLKDLYDSIASYVSDIFNEVSDYFSSIYDTVVENVISIGESVNEWVRDAYESVKNLVSTIADDVSVWLKNIFDTVSTKVNSLIVDAASVVNAIKQAITDFITNVVDTVGGGLRTLLEATAEIPNALAKFGDSVEATIRDYISKQLKDLPDISVSKWIDSFNEASNKFDKESSFIRKMMIGQSGSTPRTMADFALITREYFPGGGLTGVIFNIFTAVLFLFGVGSGIANAQAQVLLQDFGLEYPYNIPDVPSTINMFRFGIVDENSAITNIRKQGFSQEDAKRLIRIAETTPPEGEALSWWLRGIYNDDQLNYALTRQGWNDTDKAALKEASYFIPPPQDLITMAVREAFSPDTATRFGQYEDFPDDFAHWAEKQGVSREWAERYWASHWALPSPQMGFEMLHRRIISESDLELLLKAGDVMPFWRDKIIKMSYAPYTRVDVRRMHKLGILSDEEVYEAYQDLGYDEIKARGLTEFTTELNRPNEADNEVELKQLTRSNIIGFYEDGIIDQVEAHDMLIAMGYSPEAAELYLFSVDSDIQRRERKDEIAIIIEQASVGLLTYDAAQDKLSELGLATQELRQAITTLIRKTTVRTKLPSKSDLDKMITGNLISKEIYRETMNRLGYDDFWVMQYLKLNGVN